MAKKNLSIDLKVEKKKVVFNRSTDGLAVHQSGPDGSFTLRLPLPLDLDRKDRVRVSLGLSCDKTLLIVPSHFMIKNGVLFSNDFSVVPADMNVYIDLENTSGQIVSFEAGDVVAYAFVLDNSGFEVA